MMAGRFFEKKKNSMTLFPKKKIARTRVNAIVCFVKRIRQAHIAEEKKIPGQKDIFPSPHKNQMVGPLGLLTLDLFALSNEYCNILCICILIICPNTIRLVSLYLIYV